MNSSLPSYNKVMTDSIFTKIIKGEIPSHKIYEDDKTLAFLDIHPKTPGHTLVIPKKQVEFLWDLDEDDYGAVMATARKVALRLKEVLSPPFIGETVFGIDVPHTHVHLSFRDCRRFSSQARYECRARPRGAGGYG